MNEKCSCTFGFPSPKIMTLSWGVLRLQFVPKWGGGSQKNSWNTQWCKEFSQLQRFDEF